MIAGFIYMVGKIIRILLVGVSCGASILDDIGKTGFRWL